MNRICLENAGITIRKDHVRSRSTETTGGRMKLELTTWDGTVVIIHNKEDMASYFQQDKEKYIYKGRDEEGKEIDEFSHRFMLDRLIIVAGKSAVTDSISERDSLLEQQKRIVDSIVNRDWEC